MMPDPEDLEVFSQRKFPIINELKSAVSMIKNTIFGGSNKVK
jgi:hypothetical protein